MAEAYTIKMPQLSDTMTEGVVVSWEKNIGDKVERGDIVATVETDKAIMDVEVFREGYLSGPLQPVDATIPVGEAMGYLVASADEVQSEGAAAPASAGGEAAPAAEQEQTEPAAAASAEAANVEVAPAEDAHTIKMPQLSDTMTEGVMVSWEKAI
ncbi:MAG: biotin/lipoyl-containing protein, partial [Thiohalophilus sp.]